jgi:hypothetical protein
MASIRTSSLQTLAATIAAAVGLLVPTQPLSAQSLADVAKKEEDRRETIRVPVKVYTNKDLKAASGQPPVAPPASTPAAAAPKDAGTDPKAKDDKGSADADKDPVKNQAYWSGKLKALQTKLEQDQAYAEAMQTRINSLTTDAVNRDDPIQRTRLERERQKALADLADLKKSVEEGKKAIAQLHEDARRAGVPPAWLR